MPTLTSTGTTMDEFLFLPEQAPSSDSAIPHAELKPWKVLIVDDEDAVHKGTKFALSGFTFEDHPIEFIDAYSDREARQAMETNTDIAVVLLDVVMENDHAGLDTVHFIRRDLNNSKTRIVLRTGQPGHAPEKDIISKYDINDYKEKTELSSRKLFTLMYSCLRSYRDIVALDDNRKGLERVIEASKHIYESKYLEEFTAGVLQQVTALLQIKDDAFYGKVHGLTAQERSGEYQIIAGTGQYEKHIGKCISHLLPDVLVDNIQSLECKTGFRNNDQYLAVSVGQDGQKNILFLSGIKKRSKLDNHLLEIFCENVLVAFDNLYLKDQIVDTQKELVYRLGEAVESRSRETGNHVKRVAAISRLLALALGLSAKEAETVLYASPLHDLGKIGIPDAILNKPGKLEKSEWEIMKTHAQIGYDLLSDSKREILQTGALISLQHHERWDGTGYPKGLKGQEIEIVARITTVADVYDALASDRIYKEAWPMEKVHAYMREHSGTHFDPLVVEALFDNIKEINEIREKFLDRIHHDHSLH